MRGPGEIQYFDPRDRDHMTEFSGPKDRYGLTLMQQMAYPVLSWFFFGARRSGRSVLMAHVLIRGAIETGREVWLADHTEVENIGHQAERRFFDTLQTVFQRYYSDKFELEPRLNGRTGAFRVYPRAKSHPWNGDWA